jgi:hypothetical protein
MHVHVLRLVSVAKMVTMLYTYTTKQQRSAVRFLWEKGLTAKDIHKEMVLVYSWKCSSCKAVHNWDKKFSRGHSKVTDDTQTGA